MSSGEPSILEYARFYGLAHNHLEIDPLQGLREFPDVVLHLDDNPDLFQIRHDCVKVPRERLVIDADAVSLLQEVTSQAKLPPSILDPEIDAHRAKRLKVEVPILQSDPEIDLLRFARKIVPDLENEFLPLETIDEEADEGLTWPSSYHKLPENYNKKFSSEKLEVKSDTLLFLRDCLNRTREDGDHATLDGFGASYEKKTKAQLLLSPLLPMSPDILPYTPSSDTGRLELLTDNSSPTKREQHDLERRLFDKDAITSTAKQAGASSQNLDDMLLESENLYSPLKDIAHPPSSPEILRRSLNARKMEQPISPPGSEQRPLWERKSVTWALTDIIPDPLQALPRPENVSSDDIDALFDASIRPIGIKAEREIEQEQLQEADTTRRVQVPVMDFSLPVAPWNAATELSKNRDAEPPYKETLQEMKRVHLSKHVWPMSGKVERELRWTPFPAALGKVETQESIAGDQFIEKYLTQPDIVNVDTLTWKPEGLRIFDDLAAAEEEVLEEGTFPDKCDMISLLLKRKFELESDEDDSRQSIHDLTSQASRSTVQLGPTGPISPLQDIQGPNSTHFSALNALSSYVNIRQGNVEMPRMTFSDTFGSSAKLQEKPAASPEPCKHGLPKPLHNQQSGKASKLLPAVIVPSASTPFVVSASVLNDRKLTRQVQKLFPSAEFFERDFDLYRHSDQRPTPLKPSEIPGATNTMADEADIILSPSTGLIWTTLQKIKQRSLPGQKARSAIRERIMCAAPRYERLVVLVSEACHGEIDTALGAGVDAVLDASDCEAMIELTTFCMSVHPDIEITFVAGGGDNLARWIVVMMVKHGISDSDIKLIQDETLWEVFLRRAGLNAFAAQVILGLLKIPDGNERQPMHEVGLAAFVRMSTDERFARFETLLGGRRLLTRIGRTLDGHW